MNVLIRTLHYC